MVQYEYKVVPKVDTAFINAKGLEKLAQETEALLEEMGTDGWRLVQWSGGLMIFMRERQ